ncbi:hypothetical protein [Micromonospora sp. NPDC051141]|uniref:hypothetical protein n=1 Tax=Micromonospora sp. NPDC051141 TaxID=3364284 RepID=UPI003799DD8F
MSEPVASFTDDEYAFLRHVRFGELPAPMRPEERMEAIETDVPPGRPDPVGGESEWHLRAGG